MDDPAIAPLIARGAAECPGIVEPPTLRELLASCIAQGVQHLDARAADLYLAAACAAGDAVAVALLDARLPALVRPALVRLRVAASDHDEIVQRVRVALLVRDQSGTCGLSGYSGRGALHAYVRSAAARIALKRLQREIAPLSADHSDLMTWLPDVNDSPELALLKQRCRDDVRAGFESAIASLTRRERTLLRQHYVDGLTIDVLGSLHQVHRSTCARWIEAAREKILRGVRRHLRATLDLDDRDLERALALVRSQLDLSLSRQLASDDS
jgi:RNA polymerase sigma-70 factor (ECF subfamily)